MSHRCSYRLKLLAAIGILLALSSMALMIGRYPMSHRELGRVFLGRDTTSSLYTLIMQIRLPRILIVILSGGALSLAGTIYQCLFQNPLVSPDVLGVSSGCGVGAILAILFFSRFSLSLQMMAFCGGIIAVGLALFMARMSRTNKLLGLVIAGIVISSIASALTMLLKYGADPYKQLPTIEFWLMGGFYKANWENFKLIWPSIGIGIVILFVLRWPLKVLTLGDEEAATLGVNVKSIRIIAIGAVTLLVAAVVSVSGVISWIGLVAPHIVKLLVGNNLEKEMPMSLCIGAILLLLADTLARSLCAAEIPVSVLTTFVGAPFLAHLLYQRGRAEQ
ncbi:MAG: iron ABC transporter permease [Candidatus Niameybacter stercoravium]|nr:iron ABC transporter permease [Candidatus Niameybacter stercoravium]